MDAAFFCFFDICCGYFFLLFSVARVASVRSESDDGSGSARRRLSIAKSFPVCAVEVVCSCNRVSEFGSIWKYFSCVSHWPVCDGAVNVSTTWPLTENVISAGLSANHEAISMKKR